MTGHVGVPAHPLDQPCKMRARAVASHLALSGFASGCESAPVQSVRVRARVEGVHEMTVNVELLEQVMTHIEDRPSQHDQGIWVNECGTAACFAGWACLLSGWQSGMSWDNTRPTIMSPDTLVEKVVPEVAIELLGIGNEDAVTLFDAQNTRQMLRLMIKDLLNGEDLRDWEDYNSEADS